WRCDSLLDLGTGTGVAAFFAARQFAQHVWAVDITERAGHFTRFGRRLKNIPNVNVLRRGLFEPCEGRQFDRIVTHPPYALHSTSGYVYADGGDDGEKLTRRILGSVYRHLKPGGMLAAWTTALDLKAAPLEQRVRAMLGDDQAECDVAVLAEETHTSE